MADYRRFISYMYLYENGKKTVNSGFVRVESRNGQCRVHIHMTGLYSPDSDYYEVFMLIRETDGYIGIAAGRLKMGQQVGEIDLSTDSNHLMGTDYALDRVSGMVVLSDGGKLYGTRWDDEPLETDHFVRSEQLSDRLVLFSVKKKAHGETQPVLDAESEDNIETVSNPGMKDNAAITVDETDEMIIKTIVNQESQDDSGIAQLTKVEENTEVENAGAEIVSENTEFDAVVAEESEQKAEEQQAMHQEQPNAYEALLQQFPQMYPFDDNSIEICVRLDLQDIGMLPMQCWLYGSNSFLLHGYYCYRHLILARTHGHMADGEEDEPVYILGVPGIWQHREQYMASMFGFGNFKPVSRENTGSGAFGYWFVNLK